jgi:protein O-GlcNAc transferase
VPTTDSKISQNTDELISEGLRLRQHLGLNAAIKLFQQAAQSDPNSSLPLQMLGNAATELGDYDGAVEYYERARDIQPKNHVIRYNLGLSQLSRGYIDLAIGELAGACYLNPSYACAQSAFIMALHYSDRVTPEEIVSSIREWGTRFVAQHPPTNVAGQNQGVSGRKPRVGFVSGDFRTHSVAHFFEPIASARNRNKFEYIFYSNSGRQDAVTERLRACADIWRDVSDLEDEKLVELIHSDRIDILVDLSGHTEGNRLAIFALRAAPIQVTYLGFPNSTGLPTIDFRITDAMTDPLFAEGWSTERLLRLPDTQWCFRPFGSPARPGPLPAREAGFITFGSFNSLTKVSDTLLGAWGKILTKLPTSHLRLTRVQSPKRAAEIVEYLNKCGVSAKRIECMPYRREVPYGLQYSGVDIALDPFPYNGVTTTCESLYVGVPTISLYGRNCVSRSGLSILSALGLRELAASSCEQYVDIAIALAGDLQRLETLRAGLRDRFEQSPLRNEKEFAKHFEELLHSAWRSHLAESKRS